MEQTGRDNSKLTFRYTGYIRLASSKLTTIVHVPTIDPYYILTLRFVSYPSRRDVKYNKLWTVRLNIVRIFFQSVNGLFRFFWIVVIYCQELDILLIKIPVNCRSFEQQIKIIVV